MNNEAYDNCDYASAHFQCPKAFLVHWGPCSLEILLNEAGLTGVCSVPAQPERGLNLRRKPLPQRKRVELLSVRLRQVQNREKERDRAFEVHLLQIEGVSCQ